MTRKRKGFNDNDKIECWRKYNGICNKCGLPINPYKKGDLEWGHYPIPKAMGGPDSAENRAPEHSWCNRKDGYEVAIPMAAKVKRIAKRVLGLKEPKMRVGRGMDGRPRRYNPDTRRWEDVRNESRDS